MKKLLACAALVSTIGLGGLAGAHGETGVKVGTLSCNERGGWGLVLGSSRPVRCTFTDGSRVEHYEGKVSKLGVDIGYQGSGVLIWEVIAPHGDPARGALQGRYAGATAGAAVGVGLGANALIGGLDRSIALQPISVRGMTGLNVSGGIGALTLHAEEG